MKKNPLDVANELISYFIQLVQTKTGKRSVVNRGKMKYSIAEILHDWSVKEVKEFLEYYVRTETLPDLADFYNRYDKIIQEMQVETTDARDRKNLMTETQEAVRKFRETYKGAK